MLRARLAARKSVLVHGPSGVGKTLLLVYVLPEFPQALYCPSTPSSQVVFKRLAELLAARKDPTVAKICRGRTDTLLSKSSISLKGIVTDALRAGKYVLVLDHLNQPSQSFATMVREVVWLCSTPVIAVARSAHMEDAGFVAPLLSDRSERLAIRNFGAESAAGFAERVVSQKHLVATNLKAVVDNIVECSDGNPGAIVHMIEMAGQTKYRSKDHIKWSPLYIDFRMEWATANAN
ncbi:MAG: NB-ARC domain-containing protein [Terriglobia bacterium]|nr:NB-ARC domain-containing protein [Terriglobia bacterium]